MRPYEFQNVPGTYARKEPLTRELGELVAYVEMNPTGAGALKSWFDAVAAVVSARLGAATPAPEPEE